MRNYWFKILLGAFAVFCVGMIGVTLVRSGVNRVHQVVEGDGPLTIPLGFIPFSVEGERLGTIDRLVLQRPEPRKVSAVEVHIDVGDSLVAQGLSGCRLAANLEGGSDGDGVNVHVGEDSAAFACLKGDSVPADLEEFGHALLEPGDVKIPLFLKRELVTELKEGFSEDSVAESIVNADSIAEAAKEQAESALAAAGLQRDPVLKVRLGDSLRRVGRVRRDSIRQVERMADSIPQPELGRMLLVLDNYDSFTYNLVQYAGELGADPVVYRNDALTVEAALDLRPSAIVISPGPCTPGEAGISVALVRAAAGRVPLLGVCLGHQAIGEAFGGRVVRADRLMHGKTTMVRHTGHDLFREIPAPFEVMRYHSLVVSPSGLPGELEVTAWSDDRPAGEEIMALCHRSLPVYGVQFHPESVATRDGKRLLSNFLALAA